MEIKDPIIKSAVEKLARAVPRALLVGGYVRDLLLDRNPKDADVEVYGVDGEQLLEITEKLFNTVDIIGESFGVIKVFLEEGRELDISLPRRESKNGKGHKGFLIESDGSMSIEDAFKRRDFTVNAIGFDLKTGDAVDPYDGRKDIEERVLRVVDEKTFQDDPLRVFRGVQFAARLGFAIEPKTLGLMKEMVARGDLDELSKDRITDEWKKLLLKADRPSIGFHLMNDLGIIERYYPEVKALQGTKQEAEWHPEGDVWTHTLMVIDEAARLDRRNLVTMLGALCHDFGKPLTTKMVDGRIRSHGHEEAGMVPAKAFCRRFTFGSDLEHSVLAITRDHLKPSIHYRQFHKGELSEAQYANVIRRLLKRLRGVVLDDYLTVTEADVRGRGKEPYRGEYTEGKFFRSIVHRYNLEEVANQLLLTGQELIDSFGLKEGKELGEIIDAIEQARDDGRIETKEQAREFVYTEFNISPK
jgi:tRNA nucleotidyltransferase (CCA-adding enzyme)